MLNDEEKIKFEDLFKSKNKKELLKDLYFLYGIAVHYVCNVEYGLYLTLLGPEWSSDKKLTAKKVEEISKKLEMSTLGVLVDKIQKHYKLTEGQKKYLIEIKDKRNYLIHHFWGDYGLAVNRKQKTENLINKLKEFALFFGQAKEWIEVNNGQLTKYIKQEYIKDLQNP